MLKTDGSDGGPAFPSNSELSSAMGTITASHPGMSLRDWFAGQALAGWTADPNVGGSTEQLRQRAAVRCYEYADAMLAESRK